MSEHLREDIKNLIFARTRDILDQCRVTVDKTLPRFVVSISPESETSTDAVVSCLHNTILQYLEVVTKQTNAFRKRYVALSAVDEAPSVPLDDSHTLKIRKIGTVLHKASVTSSRAQGEQSKEQPVEMRYSA